MPHVLTTVHINKAARTSEQHLRPLQNISSLQNPYFTNKEVVPCKGSHSVAIDLSIGSQGKTTYCTAHALSLHHAASWLKDGDMHVHKLCQGEAALASKQELYHWADLGSVLCPYHLLAE